MANEVYTPPDASTTGLLKGIVSDVGDLIRQEVRFARAEIKADLHKTKEASTLLAVGVGVALLGVVLLTEALALLLWWLSLPAGYDPARIPLWGCFGITGGLFLVVGAVLAAAGKKRFDSFNPLPDQTAQTVKENTEWIMNSK